MYDLIDTALLFVFLGALVTILYSSAWQNLCVDSARQEVFEARDAIFDLAADGRLSFDSPIYKEIRADLESLIRFGHRVSWPWIAFYFKFRLRGHTHSDLNRLIASIDDHDVRFLVQREISKAAHATVTLVLARAPLLWLPLFVLFMVTYIAIRFIPYWRSRLATLRQRLFDMITSEAKSVSP
jgi:hypothetical protein